MKISVVIMAYNRKNYLKYAIDSVINQTLSTNSFEILLLRNFHDDEIDKMCVENKIKDLLTPNIPIGEYLSIALKNSTGDVLCFLDDDDVFENNKLDVVYAEFNNNPNLVYMRNDWSLIDSNGNQIFQRRKVRALTNANIEKFNVAHAIKKVGLEFRWNMSCISVRKDIFIGFEDYLSKIISGQDIIVFYIAASKNGTMARCKRPLTRYRIHGDSMTKVKGPSNDALREYISLKPLQFLLLEGIVKDDLEKALAKIRSISIWDGSSFTRKDLREILISYIDNKMYNKYDIKVLVFIMFVITLSYIAGGKGIRTIRKAIATFWSYEENF